MKYIKLFEEFITTINESNNLSSDIAKSKKNLIAKAKKSGFTENFGEKEVKKLEDKYGSSKEISDFENWCSNLDLSNLNEDFNQKLDFEQLQIISDAIRGGTFVASSEFDERLGIGFDLKISDFGGFLSEERLTNLDSNILNKIADEIQNGKTFGLVETSSETNLEWELELGG